MKLTLAHTANPDVRGGYWDGVPAGPKRQVVEVASLAEASAKFVAWRDANGLGGGNIDGRHGCGEVRDGTKVVARISYNGRAWEPGDWPPRKSR